jgi:hypothetical protein
MMPRHMAPPDLLNWPPDQPVRLSGPPGTLRIPVRIGPAPDGALALHRAALIDVRSAAGEPLVARSVTVGFHAAAPHTIEGRVRLRLDPATAPGRYTGGIEIAGVARPIEITIIEQIDLIVGPSPLLIDTSLGLSQPRSVAFENRGNVSLNIDVAGEYPLGEEIALCSEPAPATEEDGVGRVVAIFAELLALRRQPALKPAGTIRLAMPSGAIRLGPGVTQIEQIHVSVAEGLSPTARYRAFVPLYNSELAIVVVTSARTAPILASKPHNRGKMS